MNLKIGLKQLTRFGNVQGTVIYALISNLKFFTPFLFFLLGLKKYFLRPIL
jgi:hypothetical protein